MRAMVLPKPGPAAAAPLVLAEVPTPVPGPGEVLIRVEVCGVCRTDLHVVEGDLEPRKPNIIPGHEVVGRVEQRGAGADRFDLGQRIGLAWLHAACGTCRFCQQGEENLCLAPRFTGWDVDGGYAEYAVARQDFAYPLPEAVSSREAAPFLCAGIIGYRALRRSEVRPGQALGLYGFGASAHVVIQVARHWGCPVYVCTRGERTRRWPGRWAPCGWAPRRAGRPFRSSPASSSRRPASWCPAPWRRWTAAAPWRWRAST